MWRSPEPRYDIASGLSQGAREYQEDAIVTDFPFGMDSGVAVLADGMGGHEAGDVASKLVVTEVFSELKFSSANFAEDEASIPAILTQAAAGANATINEYVGSNPAARGMGATLVSVVLVENRMFWMSIGDSPLYVLRDGKLQQVNEDHSMAPQIDFMVQQGILDAAAAKDHPDRHCLTSVIVGSDIPKKDCPVKPFELKMGDIVVMSSDGLQYLGEPRIQKILHRYRRRKSAEIAGHLLEAISDHNDPDQDNVSFSVIKLNHMKPVVNKIKPKPIGEGVDQAASLTRVIAVPEVANVPEGPEPGPAKNVLPMKAPSVGDKMPVDAAPSPAGSEARAQKQPTNGMHLADPQRLATAVANARTVSAEAGARAPAASEGAAAAGKVAFVSKRSASAK